MAEVEIAGAKIKGGRLMLLVPIVSALGGGLWGGFEFYNDYMDMKEIIQEKQNEGKTIIFSTHQMEQVEKLCNNICLINNGKIVLEGDLNTIRNNYSNNAVEVRFSGDFNKGIFDEFFSEWSIKDNVLSGVLQKKSREFINWINMKSDIQSFQVKIPTLEQIFIEEVKKTT